MPIIHDSEFGEITVRANHQAKRISVRVAPNGKLRISTPTFTPALAVKSMISLSRSKIRKLVEEYRSSVTSYDHDQPIGKSHCLVIQKNSSTTEVKTTGTKIFVNLKTDEYIGDSGLQSQIRQKVISALRKEAKSYLPRRLEFLAKTHGYTYGAVKMTHAGSRWGSCSSSGTISLNISLMKLPFELLDYVLIHELCHTKQMNHSLDFWKLVKQADPHYKLHRNELRSYTPNI